MGRAAEARLEGARAALGGATSSTSVFHAPQPTHRPSHRAAIAPHAWQVYWVDGLAMWGVMARLYGAPQGSSARRRRTLRPSAPRRRARLFRATRGAVVA